MSKPGFTEFLSRHLIGDSELPPLEQFVAIYGICAGGVPFGVNLLVEGARLVNGTSLWLTSSASALAGGLSLVLFGLTFAGGLKIWKGRPGGHRLLLWSQVPQTMALAMNGFLYSISTGLRVLVGFWGGRFFADAGFGRAKVLWSQNAGSGAAINLVALALIALLLGMDRKARELRSKSPFEGGVAGIRTLVMKKGSVLVCAYCGTRNIYSSDLSECSKCSKAFHFD